jgi:hypothetical protein
MYLVVVFFFVVVVVVVVVVVPVIGMIVLVACRCNNVSIFFSSKGT